MNANPNEHQQPPRRAHQNDLDEEDQPPRRRPSPPPTEPDSDDLPPKPTDSAPHLPAVDPDTDEGQTSATAGAIEVPIPISPESPVELAHPLKAIPSRVDQPGEPFDKLPPSDQQQIREQLADCENAIHQSHDAWQIAVKAYNQIRDQRLYRAEGFFDFASYCKERLKLGKSTVNRQIAIGEVYGVVASTGAKVLPTAERQMRPLLKLREQGVPKDVWSGNVQAVWKKVVHDAEITKKPITQKRVVEAMKELGFYPEAEQVESDLDVRWQRFESTLWHEKEFWPGEHQHDLCVRIASVLAKWNDSGKRAPESKPIDIDAEVVQPKPEPAATTAPEAEGCLTQGKAQPVTTASHTPSAPVDGPKTTMGTTKERAVLAPTAVKTKGKNPKPTTVGGHIRTMRDEFEAIIIELQGRQEKLVKNSLAGSNLYKAIGQAIIVLENVTAQLAQILGYLNDLKQDLHNGRASVSVLPFRTGVALRGKPRNRVLCMTEMLTPLSLFMRDKAPKAALELENITAVLDRTHWGRGL